MIEAKIRMQQEELREQKERMHRRQETSSSVGVTHEENIDCSTSRVIEGETITSSHDSNATPMLRPSLNIQHNRSVFCFYFCLHNPLFLLGRSRLFI